MIRRRAFAFVIFIVVGTGVALVHELTRAKRPAASPVTSPLPAHPDELERLEGGFTWTATRGGRPLFRLDADSMYRVEGGVQFLNGVKQLALFLEDGREVEIEAERGRMEQGGRAAEQAVVRLEETVKIRDPDGMLLETDALVYDSERREIRCVGTTRITDETLEATVGSLVYKPDNRLLEGLDELELYIGDDEPSRIDTSGATYRMTTGELVFDRPFRARRAAGGIVSGPGVMKLARADRPAIFETAESVLLTERAAGGVLQLVAAGLVTRQDPAATDSLEGLTVGEPASLVLTRTGDAGPEIVSIASSNWIVEPEPASGMIRVAAGPGFRVEAMSGDERLDVAGTWLELTRAPSGTIRTVVGREEIVLEGPENLMSTGSRFEWHEERPETFLVSGSPATARKDDDVIEAPELSFDRAARSLRGTSGVLAELASADRREDAVFSGGEPIRVRSDTILIPRAGGEIVFGGPVQAWQGASSLRAASLRYDRDEELLIAEDEVTLRVDRPSEDGGKTIGMTGDRLDYSAATRVAVLSGRARYQEPGVSLSAEVMRIHLTDGGEVERLVATGSVRLRTSEAKGRADRLTWEGGAEGTVWLIGERDVASFEVVDEGRSGVLNVSRIRYELSTGRAHVESGPGRGTLVTTPDRETGDDDGTPPPGAERKESDE